MIKKYLKCICLITIIFIIGFPIKAQAKPVYVLDCADNDTECQENFSDMSDTDTDTGTKNDQSLIVKKDGSLFLSLIQTFFALLLVLALIYLLLKLLNKRNKSFSQIKALENLGGIPIGQNKSIQLVRVGTKIYLLGVGDNVELLEEITDHQLKDELLHREQDNNLQINRLFSSFTKVKTNKKSHSNITHTPNDFKNLFTNELTRLKQTRTKIKDQHTQREDLDE